MKEYGVIKKCSSFFTDLFPLGIVFFLKNFLLLIAYSCILRFLPFNKVVERIEKLRDHKNTPPQLSDKSYFTLKVIWKDCTKILNSIFCSKKPCLRRSLILYRWCCQNNIDAQLIIGVKKDGVKLISHAWLSIQGKPFHEEVQELLSFTPIFIIPFEGLDDRGGKTIFKMLPI